MEQKITLTTFFILFYLLVQSQSTVLNQYVKRALENNSSLKIQELGQGKNLLKLREIKGKYLPSLSFHTRYSRAFGGRTFEIPTGDLLNPVFQNLNQLNTELSELNPSLPMSAAFGAIGNNEVNFLRNREQETYLRVVMPIFNPTLNQTKILQNHQVKMGNKKLSLSEKEILYKVKKSYYNYVKIKVLQDIFSDSKQLAEENIRTVKSLIKHHQMTADQVHTATIELRSIETQIAVANQKEQLAKAYFNGLLESPYSAPIQISEEDLSTTIKTIPLEEAILAARQNRLEFQQIELAKSMAEQHLKKEKANRLPELNLIGDYGFQGTNYALKNDADYGIASVVLSWNILDGSQSSKVAQVKMDQDILEHEKVLLEKKIEMEVLTAFYEVETARTKINLAIAKKENAAKAFQSINKKFKQGQSNLLEITNAQTQLVNSKKEIIMAQHDLQVNFLALEKAMGI